MEHFVWNFDPEIFRIGSFGPRYYGLLFAFGFLVGYQVMMRLYKQQGRDPEELSSLLFHMMLGTIIGARLGHVFFYEPVEFLSHPLRIFMIWQGGLASHGGVIGVTIGVWLWWRKHRGVSMMWLADAMAAPICFAAGCIRLGNFFNSEMIGHPAPNLPWAIIFKRVDDLPRHPAMLYEAAVYFLLSAILYVLWFAKKGKVRWGLPIGILFTGIFTGRIVIEFFKENQVDFENGMILNMGQLLSIPFVLIGLFFIFGLVQKMFPLDEKGFLIRSDKTANSANSAKV